MVQTAEARSNLSFHIIWIENRQSRGAEAFICSWTLTWQRLKELQETVWPQTSRLDLLAELCKALLAAGQWKLARSYLTGTGSTPVPTDLAEDVVISAARDFFYSASSLDAAEVSQVKRYTIVVQGRGIHWVLLHLQDLHQSSSCPCLIIALEQNVFESIEPDEGRQCEVLYERAT